MQINSQRGREGNRFAERAWRGRRPWSLNWGVEKICVSTNFHETLDWNIWFPSAFIAFLRTPVTAFDGVVYNMIIVTKIVILLPSYTHVNFWTTELFPLHSRDFLPLSAVECPLMIFDYWFIFCFFYHCALFLIFGDPHTYDLLLIIMGLSCDIPPDFHEYSLQFFPLLDLHNNPPVDYVFSRHVWRLHRRSLQGSSWFFW